jgi:hypothetical protein
VRFRRIFNRRSARRRLEDSDLMATITAWSLARRLEPEESAKVQVDAYARGIALGLPHDEVMDRIVAAMVADEELPF